MGLLDWLRPKVSANAGPRTAKQVTGGAGERAAEKHLKRLGYRILARNVACPRGELDLVAAEPRSGTVCFIEVRSRTAEPGTDPAVDPESTVTLVKRRRVIAAARHYLAGRRTRGAAFRFDVVAVRFAPGDADPDVRHYPGAFDVRGRLL